MQAAAAISSKFWSKILQIHYLQKQAPFQEKSPATNDLQDPSIETAPKHIREQIIRINYHHGVSRPHTIPK